MSESTWGYASDLARWFTNPEDLPKQPGPGGKLTRTQEQKRELFLEDTRLWDIVLSELVERLGWEQARRIIECSPSVPAGAARVTDCPDFLILNDYFRERRDVDGYPAELLGRLARLFDLFQRKVESRL